MFIELKNAVKKYGKGEAEVYALDHAQLELEQGKICVILGPSGSGKSTLLNMLGGLDTLDEGSLTVAGLKVTELSPNGRTDYRKDDIGFVFQFYNLIPDLTVEENIEVVSDISEKPFDMDELIARIASLIRRYTRFNHQAGAVQKLDFDGLQIDLENRSVTTETGTFELPPKEFDLLLYCAKHQGKILTKQQIYEEVWGEEYFYDDSNIMAIISRLRKKLEVNPSSPKYIQTVKGIGYRFNKEV